MKHRWIFVRSVLVLSVCAMTSHAQWSSDPTINTPICIIGGGQVYPEIVSDGSGGAIITWMDGRTFSNWDVYVQRIDATGTPMWTLNGVALCTAADAQLYPKIIGDGTGGAIVAWWDVRNGMNSDIYAQRVDAFGNIQWIIDGIPICTAVGDQKAPALVSDGANGAFITWQDKRNGQDWDIYAIHIDATGNPKWTPDGQKICTLQGNQLFPALTNKTDGGVIIAWENQSMGDYIFAQSVDASGSIIWAENGIAICPIVPASQMQPYLVSDDRNGAIVVWHGYDVSTPPSGADIFAQRISATGALAWGTSGVAICRAAVYQIYPKLCGDGASGAIFTWQDPRIDAGDIYAQRVSAEGILQWITGTDGVRVCTAAADQCFPVIVSDGSASAIIAWQDGRNGTLDIYAQKVDDNGITKWTADGVAISVAMGLQNYPTIAGDGFGGAIITWKDQRYAGIYAQNVDKDGKLGAIPPQVQIENIIDDIENLISDGVLNEGQGNALISKLQNVLQRLDQGNVEAAINILYAFINQVEAFINSGTLTLEQGQALIDAANAIIATLNNPQLAKAGFQADASEGLTAIDPTKGSLPAGFQLLQNSPNPFNPTTTISYMLAKDSQVRLKVYNTLGQVVAVLVDGYQAKGSYNIKWDAHDQSSGIYLYQLKAGEFNAVRKMFLQK